MNKTTIQTLIDKVIGKKGLIRVPSWWMRKVLMQIADWVQEGDDANGKKIVKVKEEADGKISTLKTDTDSKISTLETNTDSKITTLEKNTNSKISTLETNTNSKISSLDSILVEIVDKAKLQHSLKMFSASGGFVFVDGVKQTIPSNTKTIIPFINTFSFKGYRTGSAFQNNYIFYIGFSATDTSMITDMEEMFYLCEGLTSIDLTGFDTSVVTNMKSMFSNCSKLTSIDLSSFNTSSVTNMCNMFSYCEKLTSLNLSSFDTSAVTTMSLMFFNSNHLTSLDLSKFDTSLVTSMESMFSNCLSLTFLDLSSFDTSAMTNMSYMFSNCSAITSLILGPNFFKTSKVKNVDFSSSTNWTNDTVVTSLVTNSYDRATAGLSTMTLKLSTETKAALTDEQKATITAKGYTIA